VIFPTWWKGFSVMRGVIGPLMDRAMERSSQVRELVAEADRPERGQAPIEPRPAGDAAPGAGL
jgi:hypothetical protein